MPADNLRLTPAQASYVLDRLVREGKVRLSVVQSLATGMTKEIREIERRLATLKGDGGGNAPSKHRRRRVGNVSPATAASRRLQGQYLGLIRQIPATRRGRFKKLAAEMGREVAVRELRAAVASRS